MSTRFNHCGTCSLADFNRALRRELKASRSRLQSAGILPVTWRRLRWVQYADLHSLPRSRDQSGGRVPVEQALRLINEAPWARCWMNKKGVGSRFPVRSGVVGQARLGVSPFGEADQLARPQGISVDGLIRAGVATIRSPGSWVCLFRSYGPAWKPSTDSHPTHGKPFTTCGPAHRRWRASRWTGHLIG